MCLALPGELLEISESMEAREGRVRFGGVVKRVRLDFVPEAKAGDYVIVHAGFALSRMDAAEAQQTLELFAQMEAAAANEAEPA
jgi:hydrogenase expression/formation protein HypC